MKRLLGRAALVAAALALMPQAQVTAIETESKPWIRYPSISPDGENVAFSYQGDIWVVSSDGGAARMLTSHAGYERSPVWSPDGKWIAFMADWNDGGDVYLVAASGSVPQRLTFHSATDEPTAFTPDGKHVLFTSRRQDAADAFIGSIAMGELYRISVEGGRPEQVMTTSADGANFDSDGKRIVFEDYKGYEDVFRKHHTSSVTRDIWTFEPESGDYRKLSGFRGEDRSPVWSPDGQSVYFLSEQVEATAPGDKGKNPVSAAKEGDKVIPQLDSSFNVWKLNINDLSDQQQITQHSTHPVRSLSIADDGTLCYGYNSEIWIRRPDGEPQQVSVRLRTGMRTNAVSLESFRDDATEFAVSPNEEEVAFVVRGEVFVANVEFGTTRRITDTPSQERSVTWGDDNRTLYYAGERDGSWNIYATTIDREDEGGFANATILTEKPILVTDDETFQPVCSPDGEKLAYLKDRTELCVLDIESGESRTVIPAKQNFSYSDGDIQYNWAPDSLWLTSTYHGHESWITEIAMANVETGEIVNMTDSGYGEGNPRFAAEGKVLLYGSDRFGERSHGSWGGESDVLAVYLTQAAYDEATLSKEELALKKKREEKAKEEEKDKKKKEEKDDEGDDDSEGDDGAPEDDELDMDESDDDADDEDEDEEDEDEDEGDDDDEDEVEPIEFEQERLDLRRRRLTLHSSQLASFDLSPDGEKLVYAAQVDDKWGLWLCEVRDRSTSKIMGLGGPGALQFSKDGKSVFLMQQGQLSKVDINGGSAKDNRIAFNAQMNLDAPSEREYIFDHAWRQVREKFYDVNLHGVDWEGLRDNYRAFLPTINNDYDFAELLSEMLGELNASHTGGRFRPRRRDTDSTASFGLLYDVDYDGDGLKVAEVIDQGPCDTAECQIEAGTVITHFNGVALTKQTNPWKLLNRMEGKPVRLGLRSDDKEWEEVIRPISSGAESNLMYERWIAGCRQRCEELSDGKIGYVHVRGMNDGSFRRVFEEVLGRNNEKLALVVDTRFNGGGWLHEDLATFLDGERYVAFAPRGFEEGGLGGEPIFKWTRPVAVLQSESNYSDAHFFPWAFREKGVGKLIGAPVPGTATAVWWETQINPGVVFGIPQVGMLTKEGTFLENDQLEPDVLVLNDPPAVAAGEDPQLEAAVQELLKEVEDQ